ncbi:MAG: hypothetical protein JNN15_17750 [Blastocatellia bacterium]|nr:hypothetical protein [Blastocatellia bacterium]
MREFLSVSIREIVEKRNLLAVAAVVGLLPILLGSLNGFGLLKNSGDIALVTPMLLSVFAVGIALVVGSSVIGRDLIEKRLSFYFSRPISNFGIWGGKVIGGYLLVTVATLTSLLPSFLYFSQLQQDMWQSKAWASLFLAINLLPYAAGLIFGVMFRSKSKWLILDLAALPLMTVLAVPGLKKLAFASLYSYTSETDSGLSLAAYGVLIVFGIMFVAAIPASFISFVIGRTDLVRSHKVLSLSLWSVVLVGLIGFHGYVYWLFTATPNDITEVYTCNVSPKGNWLFLSGSSWGRGYVPSSFLLNPNTKNYIRTGFLLSFSESGSRALWVNFESYEHKSPFKVFYADLDSSNTTAVDTNVILPHDETMKVKISPDGTHFVAINSKLARLFEVKTGKEIAGIAFPLGSNVQSIYDWKSRVEFLDNNQVNFYRVHLKQTVSKSENPQTLNIIKLNFVAKKIDSIVEIKGYNGSPTYQVNNGRLLTGNDLSPKAAGNITVYDSNTGTSIASVSSTKPLSGRLLSDGRFAVLSTENDQIVVKIFSTEGVEEKSINLGQGVSGSIQGESAPGHLIVITVPEHYNSIKNSQIKLVNTENGEVSKKLDGYYLPTSFFWLESFNTYIKPGSEQTKVYFNQKSIIRFDMETGEKKVLFEVAK